MYQRADLLAIDSMPFLRIARLLVNRRSDSMYGPDMIREVAREAPNRGYRFYLYGAAPGTPERLKAALLRAYPELAVVGTCSPPFRELTEVEDDAICREILACGANIVWVGLGSPKQDIWIEQHRHRLPGCVLVAAGALFDFFSGRVKQSPRWIRNLGFEWLFRLFQDPGRLWKRYTLYNILFVGALLLELAGILHLDEQSGSAQGT